MEVGFIKMHGLGNDFVVLDGRAGKVAINEARAVALADRRIGIGCDQLIVIEKPVEDGDDAFMRIFNADGSEVSACGNASRCIAQILMGETGRTNAALRTRAGRIDALAAPGGLVTVDMGPARLDWSEIPLARACDTLHVPFEKGPLDYPVCTNVGNPHATFFVRSVDEIAMHEWGPQIERDPMFPERVNVGVAEVRDRSTIRLRVWERGTGLTLACGTGACAALVGAVRRGLTERTATLLLDGGELSIEWREDGHVLMTGPAAVSFRGFVPAALVGV